MNQQFDAIFENGILRPLTPLDLTEHEIVRVSIEGNPRESSSPKQSPGESLRRSFGGWSEDSEDLDEFLKWNREQRRAERSHLR